MSNACLLTNCQNVCGSCDKSLEEINRHLQNGKETELESAVKVLCDHSAAHGFLALVSDSTLQSYYDLGTERFGGPLVEIE